MNLFLPGMAKYAELMNNTFIIKDSLSSFPLCKMGCPLSSPCSSWNFPLSESFKTFPIQTDVESKCYSFWLACGDGKVQKLLAKHNARIFPLMFPKALQQYNVKLGRIEKRLNKEDCWLEMTGIIAGKTKN